MFQNPWIAPVHLNCHPVRFQVISPFLYIKGHNVRKRENERNGEGRDERRLCLPDSFGHVIYYSHVFFFRVINFNFIINQQFGQSRTSDES